MCEPSPFTTGSFRSRLGIDANRKLQWIGCHSGCQASNGLPSHHLPLTLA